MNNLQKFAAGLRRFSRLLAQLFAGSIIVLALLVGLARLLLPEVSRFRDDIQNYVATATGFRIEFELLSAGVSIYGPELRLSGTTLQWPDGAVIAQVDNIAVSLDLPGLVTARKLLPSRILIKGTTVAIGIAADGEWMFQGRPWRDYLNPESGGLKDLPESRLQLEEIAFNFRDAQRKGREFAGTVNRFDAELDDLRLTVAADIDPDTDYGRSLDVQGELPLELFDPATQIADDTNWHLQLAAKGFRLN